MTLQLHQSWRWPVWKQEDKMYNVLLSFKPRSGFCLDWTFSISCWTFSYFGHLNSDVFRNAIAATVISQILPITKVLKTIVNTPPPPPPTSLSSSPFQPSLECRLNPRFHSVGVLGRNGRLRYSYLFRRWETCTFQTMDRCQTNEDVVGVRVGGHCGSFRVELFAFSRSKSSIAVKSNCDDRCLSIPSFTI
jgi:hypothetical protein